LIAAQLQASALHDFDSFVYLRGDSHPGGWQDLTQWWILHQWEGVECPTWKVQQEILSWSDEASRAWNIEDLDSTAPDAGKGLSSPTTTVRYTMETPQGPLTAVMEYNDHTLWLTEHPLKVQSDIDLLAYRPEPAGLPFAAVLDPQLARVANQGVGIILLSGVWHQACDLRGSVNLIYDVHDDPEWVHRLLAVLREWLVECVREVGRSKLQVIVLNESHVGLGLSPRIFKEFILPEDRLIVEAMQEAGMLVLYHICGRSSSLLELMAETGADGIETLTPPEAGGDTDLEDAKRRVGSRVCLRGGFNQHFPVGRSADEVEKEVRRCLDAAARGGGYILAPSGFFASGVTDDHLAAFRQAAVAYDDR
jgi:hypothetical protein